MNQIHKTVRTRQIPFGAPLLAILMMLFSFGKANAQCPTITFALTGVFFTSAEVGTLYTLNASATASPATGVTYSVLPALPAGLTISVTGRITGIPTTATVATTYAVTATTSPTCFATQNYNFAVNPDFTPPTITYAPLANSCVTGVRTLLVSITDGNMPISGIGLPVLYWKINGATTYTAATGVVSPAGAGIYSFTFGAGVVAGDFVFYYVVAQDNANNISVFPDTGASGFSLSPPAVSTPPTSPSLYTSNASVLAPGTYTVGIGGTYSTITTAVDAYNASCLSGAVVFSLISATYPAESFPIIIGNNITASATNTLTIKPAAGISPVIINSIGASHIIKLMGADFITIDGSNTMGGTTRNLTMSNTNLSLGSNTYSVIWNASNGSTDGANNNTFKNLNISGGSSLGGVGIFSGSGTSLILNADIANNNTTIQNNAITKLNIGIGVTGSLAGDIGNVVTQNIIGSTVAADYMGLRGMFFRNNNGIQVTNNTVTGVVGSAPIGMNILSGNTNCTFNANIITNIEHTASAGGGRGISVNTLITGSNNIISNNSVSDIKGQGSSILNAIIAGIVIDNAGGIKVYNNSVNLGSGSFAGNVTGTISATLYVSSLATDLDIRNNIFATNLVNSAAATAKTYAIYSTTPNTAFTNMNNNDYFVSGTQGVLGFLTSDRVLLADVVTGFGQNVASVNIDPAFTSAVNLLPTATTLNNLGTPIAGITTDILGTSRNATTPDMGAYEFGVAPVCPTITFANTTIISPNPVIGTPYTLNTNVTASAGTLTYSVLPALPAGLSINTLGQITGTPTGALGTPSATYAVRAATSTTCFATQNYTFAVNTTASCPTITFANTTIISPNPVIGTPYTLNSSATASTGTLTYSVLPTLPAGLSINANGQIVGTPIGTASIASATYVVKAETSATCFVTQNYTFAINQNLATAIDNALANLVKISPNPSNGNFSVDFGGISMVKSLVRVYDAQGKVVFIAENNTNLMLIPLEKFTNGIYLMEVETSKGKILKRLAKQ